MRSSYTRRDCLRALAAGAGMAQAGCLLDTAGGLYVWFVFFGQRGSELYLQAREIRSRQREAREKAREDAEALVRQLDEQERLGARPPEAQGAAYAPSLSGAAAGVAGGPAPGGSAQLLVAQAAPADRALYLLDTLGDGQVDGRVYAFSIQGSEIALRGQVGLRPADNALPAIQLRHIALSPDGNQLIVSQQGAPSQWIFLDALSLSITARVPAPEGEVARRAAFSAEGRTAFLVGGTNSSLNPPATLHVADATSHALTGKIELPAGVTFDDIAVTPDGGLLLGAGGLRLHSIDLRSGTYGGQVLVARPASDPAGPRAGSFQRMVMHPGGGRVYASGIQYTAENRYTIGGFDVRSLALLDEIPVAEGPVSGRPLLGIAPAGDMLFYAAQLGTSIQAFEPGSGVELLSIPVEADFRLSEFGLA